MIVPAAPVSALRSVPSEDLLRDVLAGLRGAPKRLPAKYFYDVAGSALFDAICTLPEYYVTRTELGILREHGAAMAAAIAAAGPCTVVEPGAGSATKTRLLLRALGPSLCRAYVPIDISASHLAHTAAELRRDLPWLRVVPCVADFSAPLPAVTEGGPALVYFPGSTLGNFEPDDATRLLARFRLLSVDGGVLLGVDLKKDPAELHAAYNDARGVTAAFNRNLLRRINAELGADFDVDAFRHYAFYAPVPGRIEMHLVSARPHRVRIAGETVAFEEGESICTEHSYKYDLAGITRLAADAGLSVTRSWLDDRRRFAVLLLRP